jgi:hypothetical protein
MRAPVFRQDSESEKKLISAPSDSGITVLLSPGVPSRAGGRLRA